MKSFDAPMNRKRVRDEDLALLRAKVPKLCRTSWTFGSRCAQPTRTAMVKWVHFFVCVRPKMWVTIHQVDIINDNLDHIILRWPAIKRQATLGGFFRIFLPALASILSISFIPQCGRICLGLGRPNFFVCVIRPGSSPVACYKVFCDAPHFLHFSWLFRSTQTSGVICGTITPKETQLGRTSTWKSFLLFTTFQVVCTRSLNWNLHHILWHDKVTEISDWTSSRPSTSVATSRPPIVPRHSANCPKSVT